MGYLISVIQQKLAILEIHEWGKNNLKLIKYLLILCFISLLVSCNEVDDINKDASDAEQRREYYNNDNIADAGEQDIKELIEIIYINRVPEDVTSEEEYRKYLEEAFEILQSFHEKFNNTIKLNGELSDDTLYKLDEITYGLENTSMGNLLSKQYDINPPSSLTDIHNSVTNLFEEHFRYFLLYDHFNMSKGNKVFKNSIIETEERIRKLNDLNKERFDTFFKE